MNELKAVGVKIADVCARTGQADMPPYRPIVSLSHCHETRRIDECRDASRCIGNCALLSVVSR